MRRQVGDVERGVGGGKRRAKVTRSAKQQRVGFGAGLEVGAAVGAAGDEGQERPRVGREGDEAMGDPALVQLTKIAGRELDVGTTKGVTRLSREAVSGDGVVADPRPEVDRGFKRRGSRGGAKGAVKRCNHCR